MQPNLRISWPKNFLVIDGDGILTPIFKSIVNTLY